MVARRGLEHRVQFLARRPPGAMPPLFAGADALLVHLRKSELSRLVIPSKTLAYLAAERPILMAMEGAAADVVSAAGAGMVLPSGDPVRMAGAIDRCGDAEEERQAMGARGSATASHSPAMSSSRLRSDASPRCRGRGARVVTVRSAWSPAPPVRSVRVSSRNVGHA